MKYLYRTALALLLALSLSLPVLADVIVEIENNFYQRHQEECVHHGKYYLTNSPQGYCNIRTAPNGQVIHQERNGTEVFISVTYGDYGFLEFRDASGRWAWGWVPLEELAPLYDFRAFAREYADQLLPAEVSVTGPLLDAYIQSGRTALVVWPYPNAPQASCCYEEAPRGLQKLQEKGFQRTYTDQEGHLWAFTGYYSGGGYENCWVLLDDLSAGDGVYTRPDGGESAIGPRIVSVREVPEVTMYPAMEPQPPLANYLPALLVLLAVVLSAAALRVFYGKKQNKGGTTCDTSN